MAGLPLRLGLFRLRASRLGGGHGAALGARDKKGEGWISEGRGVRLPPIVHGCKTAQPTQTRLAVACGVCEVRGRLAFEVPGTMVIWAKVRRTPMHLKPIMALASLILTAFVAGCTTPGEECVGEAAAGGAMAGSGYSTGGSDEGHATAATAQGGSRGFGAAGYSGGEAYAAGGCGPCAGEARAGPGYAEVSGGCMGCEGAAAASAGSASASGDCMGCTGGATAEGSARSDGFAAAGASGTCFGGTYVATKDVSVYSFAGLVTGASPADPMGDGQIVPTPIAKSDSFVVSNGTLSLMFASDYSGSGSGRIEVYGPANDVVYHSADHYCAGAAGVATCTMQGAEGQTDVVAPGTYTVHYLVAGAADVTLDVVATVLVGSSMVAVATETPQAPAEASANPAADVLSLQAPLV